MSNFPRTGEALQSRTVDYLLRQQPSIVSAMRVNESMLHVLEILVSAARGVITSNDPQEWLARAKQSFDALDQETLSAWSGAAAAFLDEHLKDGFGEDEIRAWLARYHSESYRTFVRKMLGAAGSFSLLRAVKEDLAVLVLAVRKLVRALMPFAVAWGETAGVVRPGQLKARGRGDTSELDFVTMVIQADRAIGEKVLARLPLKATEAGADDLTTWGEGDTVALVERFRVKVAESTARRIENLNSPLLRKLSGARSALQHSDDGISQAANSLIELIDRIMREAYPPATVLRWIDAQFTTTAGLTHFDRDGVRKPTKYGEALCFAYGGGSIARLPTEADDGAGSSVLHEMIALALAEIRDKLQKIKHADQGTPEERDLLVALFIALESALMLGTMSASATPPLDPLSAAPTR